MPFSSSGVNVQFATGAAHQLAGCVASQRPDIVATVHMVTNVSPELLAKVKTAIKEKV
jgi:hypothetical protein